MQNFNVTVSIRKYIEVIFDLDLLRSISIFVSFAVIVLCYPIARYQHIGSESPENAALFVKRFQGDSQGVVINSYNSSLRVELGTQGVGGGVMDIPAQEGAAAVVLGGCVKPVSLSVANRPFSGIQVRADQLVEGSWRGGSLILHRDARARCFRAVVPLEEGASLVRYRVRFLHASGIVDISDFSVAWLGRGRLGYVFQLFLHGALLLFGGMYVAVWLRTCKYLLYFCGMFCCVAVLLLVPGGVLHGIENFLYSYVSDLLVDYYLVSHFFVFLFCGLICSKFLRTLGHFEAVLDALCFLSISEALQVFSVGREPSFSDLTVDLFGFLLGIVVRRVGVGLGWSWSAALLLACAALCAYIVLVVQVVVGLCGPW